MRATQRLIYARADFAFRKEELLVALKYLWNPFKHVLRVDEDHAEKRAYIVTAFYRQHRFRPRRKISQSVGDVPCSYDCEIQKVVVQLFLAVIPNVVFHSALFFLMRTRNGRKRPLLTSGTAAFARRFCSGVYSLPRIG
jgi:hypothetical protein